MLAIRVARIFDGRDLLPGAGVVFVDGDRIVGVEPAGVDIPGDCEVLDRPAGTLLPGLIDAHVHLVADSGPAALLRSLARTTTHPLRRGRRHPTGEGVEGSRTLPPCLGLWI